MREKRREEKVYVCVYEGLIEGRAVMPGNMESTPQSPKPQAGRW